jgi:DNA-binding NarL/FixJ family response regulator
MCHERQQLADSDSHVDDHPLVREGIAGLVGGQRDMTLVAEAA